MKVLLRCQFKKEQCGQNAQRDAAGHFTGWEYVMKWCIGFSAVTPGRNVSSPDNEAAWGKGNCAGGNFQFENVTAEFAAQFEVGVSYLIDFAELVTQ